MKEFDADEALDTMVATLPAGLRSKVDDEDVARILDLIFDYFDREDEEIPDFDTMDEAVADIARFVRGHIPQSGNFTIPTEHFAAMIAAELDYEDTLDA